MTPGLGFALKYDLPEIRGVATAATLLGVVWHSPFPGLSWRDPILNQSPTPGVGIPQRVTPRADNCDSG